MQLTTDFNQHTVYTLHLYIFLACSVAHVHRQSSPFTFLTSHAQLAHVQTCVTRYIWMCLCHFFHLKRLVFVLPWDTFTSQTGRKDQAPRWLTTHIDLQFTRRFMLFPQFFQCSRAKWASQLAGSRKVQNVHISQFGKCKYVKTVVDLSSCVCCQFFWCWKSTLGKKKMLLVCVTVLDLILRLNTITTFRKDNNQTIPWGYLISAQ